jgi:hypothetical protein
VAFAGTTLGLVGCSNLTTYVIAGAGPNPVVLENGRRVAHFGYPHKFATAEIDESGVGYRVGDEAHWSPLETPTEIDEDAFRRSWAAVFATLAMPLLLLITFIQGVRQLRLEHRVTGPEPPNAVSG